MSLTSELDHWRKCESTQKTLFCKIQISRTVKKSSEMVDVTEAIGYEWQRRWNEDGYDGLIPRRR
jgi:hypothetical protein